MGSMGEASSILVRSMTETGYKSAGYNLNDFSLEM